MLDGNVENKDVLWHHFRLAHSAVRSSDVFFPEKMIRFCESHFVSFYEEAVTSNSVCWPTSVTRLGNFWKFLSANLLTKVAQKYWCLSGYFEIDQFMYKTDVEIDSTTFGNIWQLFPSNIWSHWLAPNETIFLGYGCCCVNNDYWRNGKYLSHNWTRIKYDWMWNLLKPEYVR